MADTAPSDLYIDAVYGSDSSGEGTSESPYATLECAMNDLPEILGKAHTIHCADGTYDEPINITDRLCISPAYVLKVTGNVTSPSNVVFTDTADVRGLVVAELEGLKIAVTGSRGVWAHDRAGVTLDRVHIVGGTNMAVYAHRFAHVYLNGDIELSGFGVTGFQAHSYAAFRVTAAGILKITGPGEAAIGIDLTVHSSFYVAASQVDIEIRDVKEGIHCALCSMFQHYKYGGDILIDNPSTPGGSIALYSGDTSSVSTNQNLTVDHFQTVFRAQSLAYLEACGNKNITNYSVYKQATEGSYIYT